MVSSKQSWMRWGTVLAVTAALVMGIRARQPGKQTFAPHELNNGDAPPPIMFETPALPKGHINFESAEEPHLRAFVVTRALNQPWSLAFLPDGSMLITERAGRLRVVRNGRGLQGLMDIALHPHFDQNKWIYLAYQRPAGGDADETVLARGTWNGTALVDVHDIFESGATETEASRITFGRDGMLYMSISAPGSPHIQRSQDSNDYASKTVRLNDDGSIPRDNPFVGRAGFKPGIFTMGHRNGHGLAVNPETGEMWEAEQGPSGGDEINVLRAGRNYGWPLVSYGRDYWGSRVSARPFRQGMEDPIVVWLPSIGLTGMTFYTGERFPHWKRNLFVGGLREGGIPGTGQIQRIVFNEHWEELRREPMLMEIKQRIRDMCSPRRKTALF
jgi:glucose/arabinose dehydrogenase